LERNRKLNPCGIILKDCKEVFPKEKYATSKYHFFSGDVTMEITRRQHWNTFDDYLNDLTKKYFKRAKKIMQAFDGVVVKELSAAEILENAAEIERLYWNVVNKQKVRLGTINAAYLYELKEDLKQNFELHVLYCNHVMIGFYTYIFYNTEMETHYIGLDYSYNNIHKTYFNILFLSVQKMIERKYEKVELGRTSKEAKANLGAYPKQIFNYIKVKNPLAKITLQYFLKRFNRSENQKQLERSPLK
jgi:superoxide dismutase